MILTSCTALSGVCVSCSSTGGHERIDVYVALGPEDFIVTDAVDEVAGVETIKNGAWYSDEVVLDQFGIMVRRKVE